MPDRSRKELVERIEQLEELVYPEGMSDAPSDSAPLDLRGGDVQNAGSMDGESLDIGEATIGQTGPFTGHYGDSGERIYLNSFIISIDSISTSSTDYEVGQKAPVYFPDPSVMTGISNVEIALFAGLNKGSGTIYGRLRRESNGINALPETEISYSLGPNARRSNFVSPELLGQQDYSLQLKVSGGSGAAEYAQIIVTGVLK